MKSGKNISSKLINNISKISRIIESFQREYPDEIRMSFKDQDQLFAKYGWYIFDGTSLEEVLIILKYFNQDNEGLAQEKIKNIIEKNFEEIETDLITLNSESDHIIKEAINCHKQELFYASTILFLSITDGISKGKLFNSKYFEKIKKRNKNHFLLDIFNEKNLINKQFVPDKSSNTELMRHGIMHGNSNNYGNKLNSLKALSLLHYISLRKKELGK
ncbi:hypothetical protein [uncultured Christiangramia sp.]|uniref:hypothetical protein n=1 Tax=uncultured Christiangramia sp. TaxID=503836 RepID=UPI0026195955|nr:hypothetical protein [uncultured Christiangramia sp.]